MSHICDPNKLAVSFIERYGIAYNDFDDNEADRRINNLIKKYFEDLTPEDLGRIICLLEGQVDVVECTREVMTRDPQSYRDFLEDLATFGINMIIFSQVRSLEGVVH